MFSKNAYAKINLFLEIVSKRPDGYHELDSVMAFVSLHDEITLDASRADETRIELTCPSLDIPEEKNLAYRAASAYLESAGIRTFVRIGIVKHIPSEAGLGGGSSDAACVLNLLQQEFGALSDSELSRIALRLGADVPFCMQERGCRARGVGEILTPLAEQKLSETVLIVMGDDRVSTKEAYERTDGNSRGRILKDPEDMIRAWNGGRRLSPYLFNRFEETVFQNHPGIAAVRDGLISSGADGALMSGSGAAVFGLFEDPEKAKLAQKKFRDRGFFAECCSIL